MSGQGDGDGEGTCGSSALAIPDSVEHDGVTYAVTSIGPRAFAGCDADMVVLPATVEAVDEAATRGSSVEAIEVADSNQHLASYEGVLYDAGFHSLLLIPEGKKGVVRIHQNASVVPPSAFSHCAGVESIEVDAGNESFYVEDGMLFPCVIGVDSRSRNANINTTDMGELPVAAFGTGATAAVGGMTLYIYTPIGHDWSSGGGSNSDVLNYCYDSHPGWELKQTHTCTNGADISSYAYSYAWQGRTGTKRNIECGTSFYNPHFTFDFTRKSNGSYATLNTPDGPRLGETYQTSTKTPGTYAIYLHCSSEPAQLNITWNANSGTTPVTSSKCYSGSTVTSPAPTRAGYTCTGWWTAASGGSKVCNAGAQTPAITSNVTYYAQWAKRASLRATLEGSDAGLWWWPERGYTGSSSSTTVLSAGAQVAEAPERAGWEFGGWWTGAGGTGALCVDAQGRLASSAPALSAAATFHAKWTLREFSVVLDLAGGELSGSPSGWERQADGTWRRAYSIESAPFSLPRAASKAGYASFDGWESAAEGAPEPEPGLIWVYPDDLRDMRWEARFSVPIPYEATLDLAGGSFAEAPEGWSEGAGGAWSRGFDVESGAFLLPAPSKAGHAFLGWALVGADGSPGSPELLASVPAGSVGDRSYVAVWEVRSYRISWDYGGVTVDGAASAATLVAYGAQLALPTRPSEADPAREHYAFAGWYDAPEGGQRFEGGPWLTDDDATFWARWEPVAYAAHLHLAGGAVEQGGEALPFAPDGHVDLPYTVEGELELPWDGAAEGGLRPVREGMAFAGWVPCDEAGEPVPGAVPERRVVLPAGSFGERHYLAAWSFALRFEVPASVTFSYDLAGQEDPVVVAEGPEVALRSRSAGPLAVTGLACEAAPSASGVVADPRRVSLLCAAASAPDPDAGWVPLAAPGAVPEAALASLGFGREAPVAPMGELPLRLEASVVRPAATLSPHEASAAVASFAFTVEGLW